MAISSNTPDLLLQEAKKTCRKPRTAKPKKSEAEHIEIFWASAMEAFFGQETIAYVTNKSIKTLEANRWRGNGIPFRKCSGRILYQKLDVVAWLEGYELVRSTSDRRGRND